MKTCTKCKEEKLFEEFGKDSQKKDGRDSWCKDCRKQYRVRHYKENKDKINLKNKEWVIQNRDKVKIYKQNWKLKNKEYDKEYRLNNKEKISEKSKEYRLNNKEYIKAYRKEYRSKNKDKIAERKKEYYIKNKDKIDEKNKEYRSKNKEHFDRYKKEYYIKNKDKIAERKKEYRLKNKSKIAEQDKQYKLSNRNKINKISREYHRNHPHIKSWRNLLYSSLTRLGESKQGKTIDLLGYSAIDLKHHLEALFTEGMTWENRSEWHIDHIIPVSAFKKDTPPHVVNKLENLRPMWAEENLSKNAKYNEQEVPKEMLEYIE